MLKEEDVILGFRPSFDSVELKHKIKAIVSLSLLLIMLNRLKL